MLTFNHGKQSPPSLCEACLILQLSAHQNSRKEVHWVLGSDGSGETSNRGISEENLGKGSPTTMFCQRSRTCEDRTIVNTRAELPGPSTIFVTSYFLNHRLTALSMYWTPRDRVHRKSLGAN